MLKNIWSVLCEHILTETGSNRHSYVQIVESGKFSEFPIKLPSFCIGTFWEKDSDEKVTISLKVSLKHPNGEVENVIETDSFDFSNKDQHIDLINPPGFTAKAPGRHAVLIEYSENSGEFQFGAELPIKVTKKNEE
ncbi:MAG: hypothetical protein K9J81_05935 [Desulfohalobiaceae bacterium]|nr:hypothetical protein [Desulfohalobiaceae bacterium]